MSCLFGTGSIPDPHGHILFLRFQRYGPPLTLALQRFDANGVKETVDQRFDANGVKETVGTVTVKDDAFFTFHFIGSDANLAGLFYTKKNTITLPVLFFFWLWANSYYSAKSIKPTFYFFFSSFFSSLLTSLRPTYIHFLYLLYHTSS